MAFVRILVADDYDPNSGRFKSSAFTASSTDKAISCFDLDCADAASGGPCAHIGKFYPKKVPPAGGPVYFWIFDPVHITATSSPKQPSESIARVPRVRASTDENGDDCHRVILNVSDSRGRSFFKRGHYDAAAKQFVNVFRCNGGNLQQILTAAEIPELHPPVSSP